MLNKINIKKICKIVKSKVSFMMTLLFLLSSRLSISVSAAEEGNKIESSAAGKGIKNFFSDLSTFLLVMSPIVGGLFALYFLIRKNAADEQDQKQWNKRLVTTGICVVGAVLVTSTITLVTGYFK